MTAILIFVLLCVIVIFASYVFQKALVLSWFILKQKKYRKSIISIICIIIFEYNFPLIFATNINTREKLDQHIYLAENHPQADHSISYEILGKSAPWLKNISEETKRKLQNQVDKIEQEKKATTAELEVALKKVEDQKLYIKSLKKTINESSNSDFAKEQLREAEQHLSDASLKQSIIYSESHRSTSEIRKIKNSNLIHQINLKQHFKLEKPIKAFQLATPDNKYTVKSTATNYFYKGEKANDYNKIMKKIYDFIYYNTRPKEDPHGLLTCGIMLLDDDNKKTNAEKFCEVNLPVLQNYDISLTNKNERKSSRDILVEKWITPKLSLVFLQNKIIVSPLKPTITNAQIPLSQWMIKIENKIYNLDKKIQIPFDKNLEQIDEITLTHMSLSQSQYDSRIWNKFNAPGWTSKLNDRVINQKYLPKHKFKNHKFKINLKDILSITQYFMDYTQVSKDTEETLKLINKEQKRLIYRQRYSVFKDASIKRKCKIQLFLNIENFQITDSTSELNQCRTSYAKMMIYDELINHYEKIYKEDY